MIISYQWLLDYLPEPLPVADLSNILTSIGLEVEHIEKAEAIKGGLEGLVIGEVLTCVPHTNADKLKVTTVSIGGDEPLNIVCGAPNVAASQKVIIAPVGATIYPLDGEPFAIKKAKIRGEASAGMICAEDEIGIGKDHDGILVLPDDVVVGTAASTYFKLPPADYAIHIGLTPNRSDANSHIGVARDVCAYLSHHNGKDYRVKFPTLTELSSLPESIVKINIKTEACPRYAGVEIDGIKVGDAPEWLQKRLQSIGVRSINNIVDITNYVLHEYGQPLHAFDMTAIRGSQINVQSLPEGNVFVALDEKERKLRADDLMICDEQGPMAMGGVFGGKDSGITDKTTKVFLESAYFNPMSVRRTSMHHGLRTDAATHFEKGVDIENVIPAMYRAASLITEIAGGVVVGMSDGYPQPLPEVTVTVAYAYIEKLSGKAYGKDAVNNILLALGFTILSSSDAEITVRVPSNKPDVLQPADIVEEILRIDGLDNIEIPQRLNISLMKPLSDDRTARNRVAQLLCGTGFQEIVTNSIVNSKYYPEHGGLVRMINSLTSELDTMRPSMLESGLEVVQYNVNRKNQDLCLYEFGKIYTQQADKYIEEACLAMWVTGNTTPADWQHKAHSSDLFYLKGIMDNLLAYCSVKGVAVSYADGNEVVWKWKNKVLCTASKVSAERLRLFDIKQDVYHATIQWDLWMEAVSAARTKYKEVPKFPAVQRDLAVVLDKKVTYQEVEMVTNKLKIAELQSFGLFDVFESEKLGTDKKSYAMNYTFQLQDRTLTDAETERLMKSLTDAYTTKLNAVIRE